MYPSDDEQFEDVTIKAVAPEGGGWSIERDDGWSFFIPSSSPVEPTVGMAARFYPKGIGRSVRGLFLAGVKVFYRTEAEDKEHQQIQMYGADATEWLRRWDAGERVWSISMGGLGPGYEQCIQITTAEILRHLLAEKYDVEKWSDADAWKRDRAVIEKAGFANATIDNLGLSGAQWGAAMSLATALYRQGPRKIMADEEVKDRHIQVMRNFPQAVAA